MSSLVAPAMDPNPETVTVQVVRPTVQVMASAGLVDARAAGADRSRRRVSRTPVGTGDRLGDGAWLLGDRVGRARSVDRCRESTHPAPSRPPPLSAPEEVFQIELTNAEARIRFLQDQGHPTSC